MPESGASIPEEERQAAVGPPWPRGDLSERARTRPGRAQQIARDEDLRTGRALRFL